MEYPQFGSRGRLMQPVTLESLAVQRPAPLSNNWVTQISNPNLTEEEELTYWSIGGSAARLLPSLAAANTLERYARASLAALESSLLSSSPAKRITWENVRDPGVSRVRYSRNTFWGILLSIGRWIGIDLLEGDNGKFDPEQRIKAVGPQIYSKDSTKEKNHNNLIDVLTSFISVLFHRAGHHRLPAKVASTLRADGAKGKPLIIEDALGLFEWQSKELAAVLGVFPSEIEMVKDGKGIKLTARSISELLSELWGLALQDFVTGEFNTSISKLALFEATHARLAALQARDFAAANADFLGYKSNPVERKIKLDYNPEEATMERFLSEKEYKFSGVKCEEKVDVIEFLTAINRATEIAKLALSRPVKSPEDIVQIVREAKNENDEAWEKAKLRYRTPTAEDLPTHPDSPKFDRDLSDIGSNQ